MIYEECKMLDVEKIREDFPILSRPVYGRPLVYLDSAATAQKPRRVIDCERRLYEEVNANVHRGVHYLSGQMTNCSRRPANGYALLSGPPRVRR